jgi:hypothetical protein
MKFSDTTTKHGLVQRFEFLTGVGDAVVSGDTTFLKVFTSLANVRYARILARLQLLTGSDGAEDTNYTSQQFSTFDIASGTGDYQFLTDAAGNTITDITGVAILTSTTATDYTPLDKLTLDRSDAQLIMSPNPSNTGIPSGYIEKNNTVFFNTIPNYTKATGGKLFYRLVPSYFVSSDTTKAPGFTEAYHELLACGSAYDWLAVNKPENRTQLDNLLLTYREDMRALEQFTRMKNPTRSRIMGARSRSI